MTSDPRSHTRPNSDVTVMSLKGQGPNLSHSCSDVTLTIKPGQGHYCSPEIWGWLLDSLVAASRHHSVDIIDTTNGVEKMLSEVSSFMPLISWKRQDFLVHSSVSRSLNYHYLGSVCLLLLLT